MLAQYRQAVDQHKQRVYSLALYSLRAREDAEDVTQEVFIKLWQHWQKVDLDKIGAWLMRVTRNSVIDHVRKRNPEQNQTDFNVETQPALESEETELDRTSIQQQLKLAIAELNEPFRSIIIMRDIQGFSYSDIEQTLDMSESQVKVYLHRARRKLRANPALRQLTGDLLQLKTGSAGADQLPDQEANTKDDEGLSHVK
ncbi:MAG: sigma-70 family RNA polymerase sigma factor [Gammaproteobacteria bacterium]|jgi:RNA polymerase sigma-70 factor (ECF subfamily)|nr:sigma-70 family RNA polymerase sigma factor [Gammaproteobacteria bacterium]MDP7455786.1 sigma-70 family RNA polymerase sigma factor [Gammaproteobacteria bacterium]HJO12007.1 sigma-70 family RNA polymerase sigma factor [Gammaproteobacteria bacterium]|tara:strand:+ start:6846 stop:7442 length:597 start_codon:yes stop_codon:yes gene_type:complete